MARAKKASNDASSVRFTRTHMVVDLKDGRSLSVPLAQHRPLLKAKPSQRKKFELLGVGSAIDWDELDYVLNVRQLLLHGASCCEGLDDP